MKVAIVILACIALGLAAPKVSKLHFRNLYKPTKNPPSDSLKPRIIGGEEAVPNSIPYQAFLEVYSDIEGWYCGGSLISENYVMTAGHCGEDATEAHITLGAHEPLVAEDTQVKIISTEVKVHEDYDSVNIVNDIAVIHLPEAVQLNDVIQTVKLPSRADESNDYAGETARISGWGLTDGFDDSLAEKLRYVYVPVETNDQCQQDFGFEVADSNICTSGSQNTGGCNGDSGGPLVVGENNDTQIGIVSFGITFCPPGYPSAFTRVTSFLDWIETNTDVVIA